MSALLDELDEVALFGVGQVVGVLWVTRYVSFTTR
jgi:hypothetical protein